MRGLHFTTVLLLVAFGVSPAIVDAAPASDHTRAVALGRAGEYTRALDVLRKLIASDPANRAYRRDAILIAAWSGDCRAALQDFEKLPGREPHEDYLLATVGECLIDEGRPRKALALLQGAGKRYPRNAEIREQRKRAEKEIAQQPRPRLETHVASDSSDQGNREWHLDVTLTQEVADGVQLYGRYLAVRAFDPQFATGDLNRAETGAHWRPESRVLLSGAYAWDVTRANESGVRLLAEYAPNDQWTWRARYDAYSEDIPLRAKAQLISGDQKEAGLDYHTVDWRWEAGSSLSGSAFSDGNQRTQLSAYAGYAVELTPRREQRYTVGLYTSRNSLPAGSTVYYNPVADQTISLTYKLTHVRDSRFQRFVDHISAWGGMYAQEQYATSPVYGVTYEQDIEIDGRSALNWQVNLGSNVYDGRRETGLGASVYYRRDF